MEKRARSTLKLISTETTGRVVWFREWLINVHDVFKGRSGVLQDLVLVETNEKCLIIFSLIDRFHEHFGQLAS